MLVCQAVCHTCLHCFPQLLLHSHHNVGAHSDVAAFVDDTAGWYFQPESFEHSLASLSGMRLGSRGAPAHQMGVCLVAWASVIQVPGNLAGVRHERGRLQC